MSINTLNPSSQAQPPQVITSMELRRQSGRVLNRLEYRGESFIISRDGKPVALLTPLPNATMDEPQAARNTFMQMTTEIQGKFADLSLEEVKKLAEEAISGAKQTA